MPRTARYAYTMVPGKLLDLLQRAPDFGPPEKVNKAWLDSIGCSSSDPGSIIRVLLFVRLVDRNGRATDLWDTIHAPSRKNRIRFANAVRQAYRELFDLYHDANQRDDKTLDRFFRSQELGAEQVQVRVLKTFRILVQFGDFEIDSPSGAVIDLPEFLEKVATLDAEAQLLLAMYAKGQTRIERLKPIRMRLARLYLEQDELLQESLRAAEADLHRASHVLAWGGLTDFLYGPFDPERVKTVRPKWDNLKAKEDLYRISDSQLIDVGKELGLYKEPMKKTLEGLLNDRNRCAHGSGYFPTLDESLGFLSKIIRIIEDLRMKWPDWPEAGDWQTG